MFSISQCDSLRSCGSWAVYGWYASPHFDAMLGLVSFMPGHLIMVALQGWSNFYSMLIGWKKAPRTTPAADHGTQRIGDLNGG